MRKQHFSAIFPFIGMVILILDGNTALTGAADGITLCLRTVIPSLFPFLVLSIMATSYLANTRIKLFSPIARLLRIPQGSEILWLIGMLGGYPTGACLIADAYRSKRLNEENSRRMLAFCSNAGPAFIFGFGAVLFHDKIYCCLLWGIHILTSLLIGILTPGGTAETWKSATSKHRGVTDCVLDAAKTMASVCSWIVLFRVILSFCQRWFLWLLPVWCSALLQAMTELANGTVALSQVQEENLCFILFSIVLGFGGLCVLMQTLAVCSGLNTELYLPGKLTQCILSGLIATMVVAREPLLLLYFAIVLLFVCLAYHLSFRCAEKKLDFQQLFRYNKKKYI